MLSPLRIGKADRFKSQNAAARKARKRAGGGPQPLAISAVKKRDHRNNHRQKGQQNDGQKYCSDARHVFSLVAFRRDLVEFVVSTWPRVNRVGLGWLGRSQAVAYQLQAYQLPAHQLQETVLPKLTPPHPVPGVLP
jgi:hypothetical protein